MKVKKLLSLITVVAVMFAGCEDTFEDIDLSKFECLKTLDGHSDEVNFVSYSPDGKYIVSRSSDKTIKIWKAKKGKCIKTLETNDSGQGEGDKHTVAYSPDGSKIIYRDMDDIKIVDANTGNCLKILKPVVESETRLDILSIAYSPDGNHIACGLAVHGPDEYYDYGTRLHARIDIFDANTGSCIKTINPETPYDGNNHVNSIAYNPNGNYIVCGLYSLEIKIFDANTGSCVKTIKNTHEYEVQRVLYSHNGSYIISNSGWTTKIWDPYTGECLKTFNGISDPMSISPDNNHLAGDANYNTINILDLNTGECVKTLGEYSYTNYISSISYSPDGTKIVSGSKDGTIRIWGED